MFNLNFHYECPLNKNAFISPRLSKDPAKQMQNIFLSDNFSVDNTVDLLVEKKKKKIRL